MAQWAKRTNPAPRRGKKRRRATQNKLEQVKCTWYFSNTTFTFFGASIEGEFNSVTDISNIVVSTTENKNEQIKLLFSQLHDRLRRQSTGSTRNTNNVLADIFPTIH